MNNNIKPISQKKAVIYCRVSSKEQVDEGNSLVSQERICREYAIKEGYEIAEVFIEKGESAKTADRVELKRMLAFCRAKKGNAHAVIAYKVDRISRNIADYSEMRVSLKRYGVDIKSVTEFFEDTPAGRFMENIIANVGQFDNEVRTERCIGGMREAMLEGRYVWMGSLGYDNVKINGKSTIAPNKMAPLMKEAFELISQRTYSTDVVRLIMAEKGLVTKKGQPIYRSNFFRLLRNPLYKGVINKFGMTQKGTFEAIVSEELFDDVQHILKGRKNKIKHYLHDNPDFPLRRFVLNEHGKQLTGYWSKGKRKLYPYYSFHLPGTTIRKEKLEEKFMIFLNKYSFDTTHLKAIKTHLIKHFEKQSATHNTSTEVFQNRILEINKQIDNLINLQAAGSISTTILADRVGRYESELEELKQYLKANMESNVDIEGLMRFASNALKNPAKLWLKSPLHIRKRLQVFDFPEGIIFNGQDFRTPKVCNVFKLKELFEGNLLPIVNSGLKGKNTAETTALLHSDINLLETKEFWETIVVDLKELKNILKPTLEQTTTNK